MDELELDVFVLIEFVGVEIGADVGVDVGVEVSLPGVLISEVTQDDPNKVVKLVDKTSLVEVTATVRVVVLAVVHG